MGDYKKVKNRCIIVAGGDCSVSSLSSVDEYDYVIAADSGLRHCITASITPDLVVGDFDSYVGDLPNNIEIIELPVKKDDTDLLFAVKCALKRGFKNIVIFGGYGSRPDQNIAMFQSMLWAYTNYSEIDVYAQCEGFQVYALVNNSRCFKSDNSKYLSIFSVSDKADGVIVKGAEYELENACLSSNYPVGVSNVPINDTTISVNNGSLIVFLVDKSI